MSSTWQEYQEETAAYFQSLGLIAETNKTVQGVRTTHDIDVLVKSHHVGFDIVWIIECKRWKRRVNKLHVLALREIVADIGADRGILLSEAGFQSGAKEAATLTNVNISSLAELKGTATSEFTAMRLRELYDQVEDCRKRYWNIPKGRRIDCGLRPDSGAVGYSGDHTINTCSELLARALRGLYPIEPESIAGLVLVGVDHRFTSAKEVLHYVGAKIMELTQLLDACVRNDAN